MKKRILIFDAGAYSSWQEAVCEHNCSEIFVDESNKSESDMFDIMCDVIRQECSEIEIVDMGYGPTMNFQESHPFSSWCDIGTSE